MENATFRGFRETIKGNTTVYIGDKTIKGDWIYGHWLGGDVIVPEGQEYFLDDDIHVEGLTATTTYPNTIHRYTGIKDKFGNMIFEQDIIADEDYDEYLVEFISNKAFTGFCVVNEEGSCFYLSDLTRKGHKVNVIGNSFEHDWEED